MKSNLGTCPFDGLPCDRFIDDLSFGSYYVKDLDGKLRFVCPRLVLKSGISFVEDLVPKELIPK
jgi:hypothetical protein